MVTLEVTTGETDVTERCVEKFHNLPQTLRLRCRPDVEKTGIFYYFYCNDEFIPRTFNNTINHDIDKSELTGNYTCQMDSPCGTFYASTTFTEGKTLHYDTLIAFV